MHQFNGSKISAISNDFPILRFQNILRLIGFGILNFGFSFVYKKYKCTTNTVKIRFIHVSGLAASRPHLYF